VAAFLHASQGRLVLHASAVSWDDGAIAFAGPSGGGKTTIAAMLCRTGARLVTDDVLVLDARPGEESVWARRGGTELRVRAEAGELADASARHTVDGRLAVSPAYVDASEVPLQAVILPRPDRGATAIDGRRLGLGEAAHILGQSQRIEGWQDMKLIGQQFESAISIAGRIPVVELTLPWAPSYDVTTAAQVVTACREKACLSEG